MKRPEKTRRLLSPLPPPPLPRAPLPLRPHLPWHVRPLAAAASARFQTPCRTRVCLGWRQPLKSTSEVNLSPRWTHSPKGEGLCKALAGNYQPTAPQDEKSLELK